MKNRIAVLTMILIFTAMFSLVGATDKPEHSEKITHESGGKSMKGTSEKPIVILGASYAAGLKIDNLEGRPVINKGIGGNQSFEMLARFDKDVTSLNPEVVILWGFINDIFRSDREKMDDTLAKIKECYSDMTALAEKNGIQPVLATEVTMSLRPGLKEAVGNFIGKVTGKVSYQEYISTRVIEINRWLKKYAAERELVVLDIQSLLTDGKTLRKKIYAQEDGSHISVEGYQVISDYLQIKFRDLN